MNCEICNVNKGRRTISGISMCEDCFSKITLLRNNNARTIAFFSDSDNLKKSSDKAREYINSLLEEKIKSSDSLEEIKNEKQQLLMKKQIENEKVNYAKSFNEYYEYDVVTIPNAGSGSVNINGLKNILHEYSSNGWRLHSIYSNELGKNAILGINSTASEDVLIFERRVEKLW